MKTDLELIWEQYLEESKLGKALATGALAASTLMGNPSSMEATTYNDYAHQLQVISDDTISYLWSKYYQGTNNKKKEERANNVLRILDKSKVPPEAKTAIEVAIYIFGGDMGVSPNVLEDLLYATGAIESNYETRRQLEGGPARGFWQVEPNTALDLVTNSKALFGNKFKQTFGPKADKVLNLKKNNPSDYLWIQNELERDDNLAAAFAAAKWIASAHKELREIKNF